MTNMSERANQEIISEYADRPRRYLNAGALLELYWGLWLLGGALLSAASHFAPGAWHHTFAMSLIVSPALLGIGMRAVRHRVIDRRTGFVEYRGRWRLSGTRDYALVCAMIVALGLAWYWREHSLLSATAVASANAALHAVASPWYLTWKSAILLALFLFGLLWAIDGAVKFVRYLRGSKALQEEGE